MLAAGDLAAAAREFAVPVTVVVGAEDRVTPPEQSQAVWEALPDAARRRFVTVPDVGHALPQQAPAALAQVVSEAVALEDRPARGKQSGATTSPNQGVKP